MSQEIVTLFLEQEKSGNTIYKILTCFIQNDDIRWNENNINCDCVKNE